MAQEDAAGAPSLPASLLVPVLLLQAMSVTARPVPTTLTPRDTRDQVLEFMEILLVKSLEGGRGHRAATASTMALAARAGMAHTRTRVGLRREESRRRRRRIEVAQRRRQRAREPDDALTRRRGDGDGRRGDGGEGQRAEDNRGLVVVAMAPDGRNGALPVRELSLVLQTSAVGAAAFPGLHAALAQVRFLRAELAQDRTERGPERGGRGQRREHRGAARHAQQAANRGRQASDEAHGAFLPPGRLFGKDAPSASRTRDAILPTSTKSEPVRQQQQIQQQRQQQQQGK